MVNEFINIPLYEIELYGLANNLILAESVIESTLCYKKIMKRASEMDFSMLLIKPSVKSIEKCGFIC